MTNNGLKDYPNLKQKLESISQTLSNIACCDMGTLGELQNNITANISDLTAINKEVNDARGEQVQADKGILYSSNKEYKFTPSTKAGNRDSVLGWIRMVSRGESCEDFKLQVFPASIYAFDPAFPIDSECLDLVYHSRRSIKSNKA